MRSKNVLVVGAGFRGFCDALYLTERLGCKVTILDSSVTFGGVMNSFRFERFYVDKGVHIFDSVPRELGHYVEEIMNGEVHSIDFVSASAFNGKTTEGFSLPDLASLDSDEIKRKILNELKEISASKQLDAEDELYSLQDVFYTRYGMTAGGIFGEIFERVYNISASLVEPQAIAQTSMGRLKFLDDEKMLELKNDPKLDRILAARRAKIGKVDDFVSIYPSDGYAMHGFCEKAKRWLERKGVDFLLGAEITAIEYIDNKCKVQHRRGSLSTDCVLWSCDTYNELARICGMGIEYEENLQHGTPMVFYTFKTNAENIRDFTYLQNFDTDQLTYRTAATGIYSKQIDAHGNSFVTSECPADVSSELWTNHESCRNKVWQEIQDLGVVMQGSEMLSYDIKRIPSSFKLARIGQTKRYNTFRERLEEQKPYIIMRDTRPFFRRDIYNDISHMKAIEAI